MPGVLAVLTGAELAADKIGNLICGWMIHSKDGSPMKMAPHPALAHGKANHVGDAVAVVIAETLAQAKDAAEKIKVDYEVLPAVVDPAQGASAGRAADPRGRARATRSTSGTSATPRRPTAAFKSAKHVTKLDIVNNRLVPNAIEPRAAIGEYDSGTDSFTLWNTTQNPHVARLVISAFVGMAPEHKLRVIAPDVGGGFGSKIFIYPEEVVCLWASQAGRPAGEMGVRPQRGLPARRARPRSCHPCRDGVRRRRQDHRAAVKTIANLGAYMSTFSSSVPTYLYGTLLSGQYEIPAIYCEVDAVYTNTVPVDAYRGAGRPEATFVVERLVEVGGARAWASIRADLRKKNFIRKFPHQTPVIMNYDAGDYQASLKKALEIADYTGFGKRKRESARHGKLRGVGFSTYIEACGIAPSQAVGSLGCGVGLWESAEVRVNPTGSVEVLTGCSPARPGPRDHVRAGRVRTARHPDRQRQRRARRHRQGAVRHGHLRLALRRGRHLGDRQGARQGRGQGQEGRRPHAGSGRRRHRVQGRQVHRRRHRQVGGLGRRRAQRLYRAQVRRPELEPGLKEGAFYDPTNFTFPAGCHICEVEVDPETGDSEIVAWTAVDDFGTVINPMIVEGQVHGGIAQGVGQALLEGAVYDKDGQLVTGSLMDYCMPRADNLPLLKVDMTMTKCAVQSARHQGLRRGRRDRGAGRGDQRHHRCDRHRGIDDAGDRAGGVAGVAEGQQQPQGAADRSIQHHVRIHPTPSDHRAAGGEPARPSRRRRSCSPAATR